MIALSLILIIFLLLTLGLFLKKKGQLFVSLLANDENQKAGINTANAFSKACIAASAIGLCVLLINHSTLSLIYISLVMVVTAGFTLSLAKKLA